MNNPNPFVPKGSLLEQQSQRRSRLKIAVFCVLAVGVTGLVAMLIQGCKRETPETTPTPALETNPPPIMETNPVAALETNPPAMPTTQPAPGTQPPAAPTGMMVAPQAPPPPTPPAELVATAAGTYEVAAGDTLEKIAKKSGVTLKALEAANQGVNPKKLKIKQKLNLPAGGKGGETAVAAPAGATEPVATGGETYTVKSGDTLGKIAKKSGVSLKALRAANPKVASTDHIHVGDKLVIPGKTEAASAPAAEPAGASVPPPAMSVPAPATTPVPATPAPAPAPGH